MAQRHLHELLREEQEPFALKRFIDERRCQLRRPPSKGSPPCQHRHHQHLLIKRHASAVLESRAFSPSALVKSPSSPFVPPREALDCKRSPLLHLPVEKSPSSASRLTAALLLEAAMRIQKQQEQQQKQKQQGRKKRRKRKKKEEAENQSKRFGLGFLASILKRLVVRKRQWGITGEEEVENPFNVPAKDLLKWEARHGGNAGGRAFLMAGYQRKEADLDMGKPHYSLQTVRELKEEDGKVPRMSICSRCGIPECPRNDGGRPPWIPGGSSVPAGRASNASPTRQLHPGPSPSPPGGPSPDLQTPAVSPDRRRTERQLFGGTGDGGRPETSYYHEKKEQFSPVSVLDPPSDEEEDHRHDDRSEPAQGDEGEREVVEEDEAGVDSFQHSLAIVQKAKQQLLSRIRRFESLAELDPLELERRLAEEDEEDEEDGGVLCDGPGTVGCLQSGVVDMETSEVRDLVRAVLGLSGCASRKIPPGTRRLVLDLAEEERKGISGAVVGPANGVEMAAEGVRRRFEAWKGVESNTIDMMVGMDLRQEGDEWRRFPELVREAAAEMEAAVFRLLVEELTEEFVHGCID